MEIITHYQNKQIWNKFVASNSWPASFLQSWEWGEFNEKILENEIQRWAIFDKNELRIILMLIKKPVAANKYYYYCPRGLIWQKEYQDKRVNLYGALLKKLKIELKDAVFLRTCPPAEFKNYMHGFMQRFGFSKPKILIHTKEPGKTLILDLTKSQKEILAEMHHKTRYNIRLAEKKGVKVREMNKMTRLNDIGLLYNLLKQTGKRNKIHIYDKNYYAKLINYFTDNDESLKLKLYVAEYKNKPLAAMLVVYFGHTATYLHGASGDEHRELMPNHLIQWTAINQAKEAGMEVYDFLGISDKNPHWKGVTRFKKGFGGRTITFLGTWDYVLDKKWYKIFRLLKIFKKITFL